MYSRSITRLITIDDQREQDDQPLDHREIVLKRRVDRERSDAREREDDLDKHRAGEQPDRLQPEDSDDADASVLQGMLK